LRSALDARMEACKTENEEKSLRKGLKMADEAVQAVPDFKAFRMTRSASVNVRKEQKVPVVPECFNFSTETRAKEREKFDEHVRARQREIERQLEERRRQREIDEQREIKEMRRRAIPKANEVPEWYANVPKRKRVDESA
jgi:Targeting protein for Xklp2 (TPX2) domain